MPAISNASLVVLVTGVLAATVIDIRTRRIPNALTASMATLGIGLAAAGLSGMSPLGAVLGLLVGFAMMLPGHVLGATGAGDVKLMAAIGSLVGPWLAVKAFLFTAIAGGVIALAVALGRRRLTITLAGTVRLVASPVGAKQEIALAGSSSRFAYAPAIAVGSLVAAIVG